MRPLLTSLLASNAGAQMHHASWERLLPIVIAAGGCDLLVTDTPYSARTHAGHNDVTVGMNAGQLDGATRRELGYSSWGEAEVDAFVDAWVPVTRGWFVTITDHVLGPAWERAFVRHDRVTFPPLPYYAPGSRVRARGDGPSCWTTWIVVSRPRRKPYDRWGTLTGGYPLPPGYSERMEVVGGKPLWLMERLLADYSKPGDMVVDPCAGAGTTLVAAQRLDRRAIGGDLLLENAQKAARRISKPVQQLLRIEPTPRGEQQPLFDEASRPTSKIARNG